ncbi:MAG: hypothetical protein ABIF77_03605 [bacterium]
MKMLLIVATVFVLCQSLDCPAQISPDPDRIGMYFDTGGIQTCADFYGGPVTLYLTITYPTIAAGVSGWECHVDYTIPSGCFEQGWTLMGSAINVSTAPDFVVGLGFPIPYSSALVVATYSLLVFCPDCIVWDVRAADVSTIPGMPAYAAGDDPGNIVPLFPLCEELVEAALNCPEYCGIYDVCGPVPNAPSTWGGLKALYR